MIRFASYIFPLLVNYVLGGVFFITALRCSQADAPGWVVGATLSTWAFIYSIGSFLTGKIVTPANAAKLIIAGGLLISLSSAGFLVFPGVYIQFVWIALTGIAAAIYCTSFQVFAKALEQDQNAGVIRATSLYTASWSLGMATGPFIFGMLSEQLSFGINLILGLGVAAGVWYISSQISQPQQQEAKETVIRQEPDTTSKMPDLVLAGWIFGGTGTIAIFVLRCLVPYRTTLLEISKMDAGIIMAAVSYIQALVALGFIRCRHNIMYHPLPAILAGTSGIISLLLFAFTGTFWTFFAAAVLFGIYSGFFYFFFVYHSLISPQNSTRYVAINEIIVGVTGTVGPLVGGMLSSPETSETAFPVTAAVCAASIIICTVILKRKKA